MINRIALVLLLTLGPGLRGQVPWEPNPFLMSRGELSPAVMAEFLLRYNPTLDQNFAWELARMYIEECALESINHDIAWAQMLLETSFFRFGGQVARSQNNVAGLGAVDEGSPGLSFPDLRTGIRGQVQHLKRYAGGSPPTLPPVHSRGTFVTPGSARTLYELSGRWASDPQYHLKLLQLLHRLHEFASRERLESLP